MSEWCLLCNGNGWLWRHELPDTSDWDGSSDDTRYDCPNCCIPAQFLLELSQAYDEHEVVLSAAGVIEIDDWKYVED